jgi:PRTRC genetic system ThiF family protein
MAREKAAAPVAAPIIPETKAMGGFRRPDDILVLGCGGTGAYVVGHLARFIAVLNSGDDRPRRGFRLILADGDKVERKNLERQHFVERDLDTNKAEALAARYSAAFGLEIQAIPSYLENADAIRQLEADMVIGCVDNNASRKVVGEWASSGDDKFWIDAGNEENSGQVVCGFHPSNHRNGSPREQTEVGDGVFSLPFVTEIYPALLGGDRFNSELSCAELAQAAPQNMMANVTAATLVLNFAQKILRGRTLRSHGAVFSVDNSFRTILNTPENLAKVSPNRRPYWETI